MTTTTCNYNNTGLVKANGFSYVPEYTPKQMTAALNLGPIAVSVDAGSDTFQFYSSGVITDAVACGTDLNHAVTLVGYNGMSNPPYFILRNSWGTSWGQNGYAWLEIQEGDGVCGVNM